MDTFHTEGLNITKAAVSRKFSIISSYNSHIFTFGLLDTTPLLKIIKYDRKHKAFSNKLTIWQRIIRGKTITM